MALPAVDAPDGSVAAAASLLEAGECACYSRFYLASIDTCAWIPHLVAVTENGLNLGVVYAKERKFAGMPTGLVYADATIGSMVVAEPEYRERVFELAIRHLIMRPGFRGLRIVAPPGGYEHQVIERMAAPSRFDLRSAPIESHSVLDLPSSYESFVASLGPRTRRNIRYYRRRFETIGEFVPEIPFPEFELVAMRMIKQSVVGAQPNRVERCLRMLSTAARPFLAGLRTLTGEFLSILGGWYDADRAVIIFQMNNERDHLEKSLSLVARGFLIETLIKNGVGSLLFWGGAGPPLDRYCHFLPAIRIQLNSRGWGWMALRRIAALAAPFLPRRLAEFASWIETDPEAPGLPSAAAISANHDEQAIHPSR